MPEIKSKYYRKSRLKNLFRSGIKKILHMGALVIIGEYMLLYIINLSLTEQQTPLTYKYVPTQIINLAISEKPILRVAEAYSSIQKNIDFDTIMLQQHPIHVRGSRPDFRALDLQDKEGANVGYVVKF